MNCLGILVKRGLLRLGTRFVLASWYIDLCKVHVGVVVPRLVYGFAGFMVRTVTASTKAQDVNDEDFSVACRRGCCSIVLHRRHSWYILRPSREVECSQSPTALVPDARWRVQRDGKGTMLGYILVLECDHHEGAMGRERPDCLTVHYPLLPSDSRL